MTADDTAPLLVTDRANTILYCRKWDETVRFYRDELGLVVVHATDWFVEFQLADASFLSIADSSRATIDDVGGQGITLSWHVPDLSAARQRLVRQGLDPSGVHAVWGAVAFHLFDPEGHRIELWADAAAR